MLCQEPSALCKGRVVVESVILRTCSFDTNGFVGGSGPASGVPVGLMWVSSTSLGVGKGDSEGDVAVLARDCGREESKELDEKLL